MAKKQNTKTVIASKATNTGKTATGNASAAVGKAVAFGKPRIAAATKAAPPKAIVAVRSTAKKSAPMAAKASIKTAPKLVAKSASKITATAAPKMLASKTAARKTARA